MVRRALLAIVCVLAIVSPAAAKDYYASRFDARIEVIKGGSLRVTETIVFTFTEGTFRQVFRTIPTRRTDGVEFVSASMDGQMMPPGEGPGRVEVRHKNGLRVEWHFGPVPPGTHTFELTYIARGVVRETRPADLLEWRALPREHDYRIESSAVEIIGPEAPAGTPRLDTRRIDGGANVRVSDTSVLVQASAIRRNGSFVISVPLPRHSVLDAPPAWQARQMRHRERMPMWLTASALVMLGGFVLVFAIRQNYDAPPPDRGMQWNSMIPPEALAPAFAGALVNNGQPNLEHAMAALFSLAERGIIVIREEPKGTFGQRHFTLERVRDAAGLAPHEQAALDIVFGEQPRAERTVTLSKVRSHLMRSRNWTRFRSAVMGELSEAGMIDPGRQGSRRRMGKVGLALLFVALLAVVPCFFLIPEYGGWPFLVPLAIAIVALVAFIVRASQTPLSNQGVRQAEQWRAFKRHISDPQGIEPRWGASGTAEARILPLAIAMGLAAAWSKYLKKRNAQTPAWFHAASGLDSGHAFAAFVAYGGASAHGGSGHGGGAGAAGGGASGAG